MICLTDLLDEPINGTCDNQIAGAESVGYIFPFSLLVKGTVTDLVATFTASGAIPVYQNFELGYKPKVEGEKNAYGLTKYEKTIEIFIAKNSELSQKQIMQLKNDDWVLVIRDKNNQYLVFGYERGLSLVNTSQELLSTETHGGILLTFSEKYVNTPMLFTTGEIYRSLGNLFPQVGDSYGGGIVAMADTISGELVIVPDAEKLALIGVAAQGNSIDFAAAYTDGVNSDYRLTTRNELIAIFGNNNLLTLLDLDSSQDYWSIESAGAAAGNAWFWDGSNGVITEDDSALNKYVLPVRKVNFYGLPLIDSEYGGGLVYDVVAETREVKIIPKWSDVIYNSIYEWDIAIHNYPSGIGDVYFTALPTRAEALKIFNNTYLCDLAGLPVKDYSNFWTSEEDGNDNSKAWQISTYDYIIASDFKSGSSLKALPVRSETV